MTAVLAQNSQAVWNFASLANIHISKPGTSIQAVAQNGSGGELAQYSNRDQCFYAMEMLASALASDEAVFAFPTERQLERARQHGSAGGGRRHGGS